MVVINKKKFTNYLNLAVSERKFYNFGMAFKRLTLLFLFLSPSFHPQTLVLCKNSLYG